MGAATRQFNLFVLLRRCDELPGIWFGEIPDIEVIAQGHTPSEALEAAQEMALLVIGHDLSVGVDPMRFVGDASTSDERALMSRIMTSTASERYSREVLDVLQDKIQACVVQLPPLLATRAVPDSARDTVEVWPQREGQGDPAISPAC